MALVLRGRRIWLDAPACARLSLIAASQHVINTCRVLSRLHHKTLKALRLLSCPFKSISFSADASRHNATALTLTWSTQAVVGSRCQLSASVAILQGIIRRLSPMHSSPGREAWATKTGVPTIHVVAPRKPRCRGDDTRLRSNPSRSLTRIPFDRRCLRLLQAGGWRGAAWAKAEDDLSVALDGMEACICVFPTPPPA